jgi:hypothetical protein
VNNAEQAGVIKKADREPENEKQNNEEMKYENQFDHRINTRYR